MPISLTQILNESAASAHAAFPHELKNLVIFSITAEAPVYISPEVAGLLTENVASVKKILADATAQMQARKGIIAFADISYQIEETAAQLIILNEDALNTHSPGFTKEMHALFILDHEIAHLSVKGGYPSRTADAHLAECTADAYATLRHIQRFGKNTEFFEHVGYAEQLVLGISPLHYTDDVIEKVRAISTERDICSLSLHETAELAGQIAQECKLDKRTLEKISTAFIPVAQAFKKTNGWDNTTIIECVRVMIKHKNDPDILKAAKRFLTRPNIKDHILRQAEAIPSWKNAISFIEKTAAASPRKSGAPRRHPRRKYSTNPPLPRMTRSPNS